MYAVKLLTYNTEFQHVFKINTPEQHWIITGARAALDYHRRCSLHIRYLYISA